MACSPWSPHHRMPAVHHPRRQLPPASPDWPRLLARAAGAHRPCPEGRTRVDAGHTPAGAAFMSEHASSSSVTRPTYWLRCCRHRRIILSEYYQSNARLLQAPGRSGLAARAVPLTIARRPGSTRRCAVDTIRATGAGRPAPPTGGNGRTLGAGPPTLSRLERIRGSVFATVLLAVRSALLEHTDRVEGLLVGRRATYDYHDCWWRRPARWCWWAASRRRTVVPPTSTRRGLRPRRLDVLRLRRSRQLAHPRVLVVAHIYATGLDQIQRQVAAALREALEPRRRQGAAGRFRRPRAVRACRPRLIPDYVRQRNLQRARAGGRDRAAGAAPGPPRRLKLKSVVHDDEHAAE